MFVAMSWSVPYSLWSVRWHKITEEVGLKCPLLVEGEAGLCAGCVA